ncbi:hypothetical protein PsorP6_016483 [Peronosclerospora sorghi]|uniref:Uncharacterized protein n=1 Tax=Peronosclerospora sorghi TaxID=230839 RepID=A0ACC0VJJ4_9STRA|nr:hypothetical protein PsorP6_016483 [Peronosclerospora sorghi]
MCRTPFQPAHELKYGLKVMHIDPAIKRIVSVRCQFCVYFGKEDSGESRDRKQTNRINTWESFRPELYESHHKGQHATHWSAYQALDHDAKKKFFFDNVQPHANTLHSHFGSRDQPLSFVLHRGVIEVIIGDLFFNSDDHGSVSHQRVLAFFVLEIGSDNAVQHYTVRIKNPLQFQLVIAHLSHGLPFRQSEKLGPSPTLEFRILPLSWLLSISRSLTRFLNPLKFFDSPLLLIPPHIVVFIT